MNSNDKKGSNPLAIGATGFLLGAAGAAAVILSDDDTREKFSKKAVHWTSDLKKWSEGVIHDFASKKSEVKEETRELIEEANGEPKELTE